MSGVMIALGGGIGNCIGPSFFSMISMIYQGHSRSLLVHQPSEHGRDTRKQSCGLAWRPAGLAMAGHRSVQWIQTAARQHGAPRDHTAFTSVFLLYIMKMGMVLSLGLFAGQVFGFNAQQRGQLQSMYGAAQALGQLSIGCLLSRFSQRQAVTLGALGGLLCCSIVAVPDRLIGGVWLYVAEFKGEAAQLMNSVLALCSGIGPLLFGLLVQAFLKTSYPGGAMLILAVVVVFDLWFCWKLPDDEQIGDSRSVLVVLETVRGSGREAESVSSRSVSESGSELWVDPSQ